jgi:hypothetical protein
LTSKRKRPPKKKSNQSQVELAQQVQQDTMQRMQQVEAEMHALESGGVGSLDELELFGGGSGSTSDIVSDLGGAGGGSSAGGGGMGAGGGKQESLGLGGDASREGIANSGSEESSSSGE